MKHKEIVKQFTVGTMVLSQLFFICSPGFAAPALRSQYKPSSDVVSLQGEVSFNHGSDPVTISLRDTDVRQVLRMLADKAHLNIIFHDSVSGTVTLDLVDAPLVKVFNYIMSVNKLSYWIDDKTIIVASSDAAKDLNLNNQEMVSLPVKYMDAKIIADFLNKNIFSLNTPGISTAQVAITNPQNNEIIIMGSSNDVAIAQKIIKKFDQKPSMTTFDVSYSSPSEIANALCSVVFGLKGDADGGGGGGAAAGASAGGGDGDSTSFGKAVVACSASNTVTADKLESIKNNAYSVVYYPDNNQIILFGGTQEQIALAKEYIEKTDIKQLQVLMDVSIVELSENDAKSLQSAWEIHTKRFNIQLNGFSGLDSSNAGGFYPQAMFPARPPWPLTSGFNYITTDTFRVVNYLNFLVTNSKARTLTNPKIVATNNKKSEINITKDYVKSVTRQVTAVGVGSTSIPQTTYEIANDAGVKLSLTPTISNSGNVMMDIEPSFATPYESIYEKTATGATDSQGNIQTTDNLAATLLTRREMKLKSVMVKDGETLVVGGLIENSENKQQSKVPFLGDIPFIGAWFRSSNVTKSKSELVIMLTPHILRDDNEMNKVQSI